MSWREIPFAQDLTGIGELLNHLGERIVGVNQTTDLSLM